MRYCQCADHVPCQEMVRFDFTRYQVFAPQQSDGSDRRMGGPLSFRTCCTLSNHVRYCVLPICLSQGRNSPENFLLAFYGPEKICNDILLATLHNL